MRSTKNEQTRSLPAIGSRSGNKLEKCGLEIRLLDKQLDDALNSAYKALTKKRLEHGNLAKVSQYQIDAAILFETVNNALKLVGDQYLARVYSLASKRFHLADWDASILLKLETLNSIYQQISDKRTTFRMEVLEAVIILLFVFEIGLSLYSTWYK